MMRYLCLVMFFIPFIANSQRLTITGQVVDEHKDPIGLATIGIVGNNVSGASDGDGLFHISLPENIKKGDIITLRISKLGFRSFTKQQPVSALAIPIKLVKIKNPIELARQKNNNGQKVQQEKPSIQVTNIGQKGGISAAVLNLTIPEDKDISPENNIQIKNPTPNSLEFSPIQGTWKIPYIELLDSENKAIDPIWYWNRFGGGSQTSYSYWKLSVAGKAPERFVRIIVTGPAASPSVPYILQFSKMPTVVIVGDQSDTAKTYIYINR